MRFGGRSNDDESFDLDGGGSGERNDPPGEPVAFRQAPIF